MSASISRRAFIQWLPDEPEEKTSTIVLTSPGSRFVDIRLLVTESNDTITTQDQIDWAFAGTSSSTWRPPPTPSDETSANPSVDNSDRGIQHTIWKHLVDSRHEDAESVRDEGDMLPSSTTGLTLEKGSMINPSTNKLTDYTEGWLDEEVPAQSACMVLQMVDPGQKVVGMLMRLGPWIQGVARYDEDFFLQRWRLEDGQWTMQAKVGRDLFPIAQVSGALLDIGRDILQWDENDESWRWTVVESSTLK